MFCCSTSERAQLRRFEEAYVRSTTPTMRRIERQVCGCDYGGNSWTTRAQADDLITALSLNKNTTLLELGSGTGWPGLYLAKETGCHVMLVDLPEVGLQIAEQRAESDGLNARVETRVADAADLPFADRCFDAVAHSDLLCCLVRKRRVLDQCRRVIRNDGQMAFTVISIVAGLDRDETMRALENAPEFAETEVSYPELLTDTGWIVKDKIDLTEHYRDSCARQVEADISYRNELIDILGFEATADRLRRWQSKLAAIRDGLLERELFICRPR